MQACEECGTHRGQSLIHLERIDRTTTTQTAPMVCMHCEDPTCAEVCPADAIKQTENGVVQSALKPRCIGCSNCVLACPFGVPKYDRRVRPDDEVRHVHRPHVGGAQADVRVGLPERGALVRHVEQFAATRRGSLLRDFLFGRQGVRTKVYTVVDDASAGPLDVLGVTRSTWLDDPFGLEGA